MSIFDIFKKKTTPEVQTPAPTGQTPRPVAEKPMVRLGNVSTKAVSVSLGEVERIRKCFIAIDFETTGLSSHSDRIVEIGAVKFENGQPIERFQTLVNPGMEIPEAASRVNHITNEMVRSAPFEKRAIEDLVDFCGRAISGDYFFCAHNASFDSAFLAEALRRNGYDASLAFVDTLSVARKYVFGVENYKQDTLARHFGIVNVASHRAVSDAEVCGQILVLLCDVSEKELQKQALAKQREIEISQLSENQIAWSAYIQKSIVQQGLDTDYLCFQGRSGNYLDCSYVYSFLRIKFGKSKTYVIAKKGAFRMSDFCTEPCVASEGGDDYIRVLFNTPFELDPFFSYIIKEYAERQKLVRRDIREGYLKEKNIPAYMEYATVLKNDELDGIILSAKDRMQREQAEEAVRKAAQEKADEEKRQRKEQRELEKQQKATAPQTSRTRAVIRLDDSGTVLEEYSSLSEAVEKSGVSSKSIRDAANGVQKHAGGFCWRYKTNGDENG